MTKYRVKNRQYGVLTDISLLVLELGVKNKNREFESKGKESIKEAKSG